MEVLAIIQARGGSKGIPKKNIKMFAGKPLISWTIEAAREAKLVNRVIVSTDDEEIAAIARSYGAEAPFLRPKELASDTAKSVGLLRHALEWLSANQNYRPDVVVQLKPTNPLRTAKHIDDCLKVFFESPDIDSLLTLTETPAHPYKTWKFEGELITPFISEEFSGLKEATKLPRQSLPKVFVTNSCVNVIRPNTILNKNSSIGAKIKGVVLEKESSINIDDMHDFTIAEFLMQKRLNQ